MDTLDVNANLVACSSVICTVAYIGLHSHKSTNSKCTEGIMLDITLAPVRNASARLCNIPASSPWAWPAAPTINSAPTSGRHRYHRVRYAESGHGAMKRNDPPRRLPCRDNGPNRAPETSRANGHCQAAAWGFHAIARRPHCGSAAGSRRDHGRLAEWLIR